MNTPVQHDRRSALVKAATEIVSEAGFRGASVKAITGRAGMSAGLLYSYATDADELLTEVFRRCAGQELAHVAEAVDAAGPGGSSAQLTALIDAFTGRALRGRRLAWSLLVEPVGKAIEAERLTYRLSYASLLIDIVERGIAEGEFPEQDARVTAAGIVGAISEALTGPLSPLPPIDTHDANIGRDETRLVSSIHTLCMRAVGAGAAHTTQQRSEE